MRKARYYLRGGPLDPALVARYYRHAGAVSRVLDLGCGIGCFGRLKPDPSIEVCGVDVDAAAVEAAARWETTTRIDLEAGRLPFPDRDFDAVFAKDVLEHLREPWRMLGEIARVLRPTGIVVASVPMEYPWVVWNDYTHVRGFTRESLALLFEDAGYSVVSLVPMGAVPLAGRLRLVDQIPRILRLPGMRRAFGRSWEIVATPGAP